VKEKKKMLRSMKINEQSKLILLRTTIKQLARELLSIISKLSEKVFTFYLVGLYIDKLMHNF